MRHILYKYLTGASLIALTFSLNTGTANATCSAMPSCESMGYTQTSCQSGYEPIKCPFDISKMKCVFAGSSYAGETDCAKLGYKESGCGFLTSKLVCPFDKTKFFCGPVPYREVNDCKVGDYLYIKKYPESYEYKDLPMYICVNTENFGSGVYTAIGKVFDPVKKRAIDLTATAQAMVPTHAGCGYGTNNYWGDNFADGLVLTGNQMDSTCGNENGNGFMYCMNKNQTLRDYNRTYYTNVYYVPSMHEFSTIYSMVSNTGWVNEYCQTPFMWSSVVDGTSASTKIWTQCCDNTYPESYENNATQTSFGEPLYIRCAIAYDYH